MERIVEAFTIPSIILRQNPKLLQEHLIDKDKNQKKRNLETKVSSLKKFKILLTRGKMSIRKQSGIILRKLQRSLNSLEPHMSDIKGLAFLMQSLMNT